MRNCWGVKISLGLRSEWNTMCRIREKIFHSLHSFLSLSQWQFSSDSLYLSWNQPTHFYFVTHMRIQRKWIVMKLLFFLEFRTFFRASLAFFYGHFHFLGSTETSRVRVSWQLCGNEKFRAEKGKMLKWKFSAASSLLSVIRQHENDLWWIHSRCQPSQKYFWYWEQYHADPLIVVYFDTVSGKTHLLWRFDTNMFEL